MRIFYILALTISFFSCDPTKSKDIYGKWLSKISNDSVVSERLLTLNEDKTYILEIKHDGEIYKEEKGVYERVKKPVSENSKINRIELKFFPDNQDPYDTLYKIENKNTKLTLIVVKDVNSYQEYSYFKVGE